LAAQAFIDGYLTGPEGAGASWRREIVDMVWLVPGFTPIGTLDEEVL
jgi:hypothetical protein